jgi:hypothetical protein
MKQKKILFFLFEGEALGPEHDGFVWDVCRPILELGPETVILSLYWRAIESLARTKVRGQVPSSRFCRKSGCGAPIQLKGHSFTQFEFTLLACTGNYTSCQSWGSVTFWCGSGSPDPYL